MKWVAWLVLVAACKAAPAPTLIANRAAPTGIEDAPVVATCELRGVVIEMGTREPLAGATIILDGDPAALTMAVITDEAGNYRVTRAAGHDRITVYYLDTTMEDRLAPGQCGPQRPIEVVPPLPGQIVVW